MKHMVVGRHNAESCAFRSEEDGAILGGALDAFGVAAAELGLTIDGSWINRSSHASFILVDAPNAHVIDEALLKAGLVGRTHTEIYPIFAMEEVRAAFEARSDR
ncbi:MAG: DUF3303 domain-containing protein [Planctomycetaceae bacterium]